jgi:OOP family OmpA-OmpF porin
VRNDTVEVAGVSGSRTASDTISQLLSNRLGQGKTFKVDVSYDKALDPLAGLPTPQECLDRMETVLTNRKIAFDPGSAELDSASGVVLDDLALALKNCDGIKLEIGGHTDAQGSVQTNLALSQARAETVMVALQGRQVDVSGMRAVGYGEGVPIADNGTEAGRETNRRIEFSLVDLPQGDLPGKGLNTFVIKPAAEAPIAGQSTFAITPSGGAAGAAAAPATGAAPPVQPAADASATTGAGATDGATGAPAATAPADAAGDAVATPAAIPSVETAADGSALAPDQPTIRPKTRPSK